MLTGKRRRRQVVRAERPRGRGAYRFSTVRANSDAPPLVGQETRYGHRVYGAVIINPVRYRRPEVDAILRIVRTLTGAALTALVSVTTARIGIRMLDGMIMSQMNSA
jgi:hypothetical protein